MSFRITKTFTFDSAHHLPHVPIGHKCGRPHGHTYVVTLGVEGEAEPQSGWVVDFGEIKRIFAPLLKRLDHQDLNGIEGLENPTAENLARWIYERMNGELPALADVTVQETPTSAAIYRP